MSDTPHAPVEQFSDEARKRLREEAEAFADAVLRHAETLCEFEGRQREKPAIFELNDLLSAAAHRLREAQHDLTGTYPSFEPSTDDGDDDVHPAHPEYPEFTDRIAVLMRHDFAITDREALMAAGRAAYLRIMPDAVEDDAEFDVRTVDSAVYQLMHVSAEDTILDHVPGLRPTASVTRTVEVDGPLDFQAPFAIATDD
ncbi:hypothetical protein ACFFV7_12900 [Nonomuraea spiralis]|uniref:Uncharacterized protein n=1 Tax=Nonomuraea spiralis TaxID=46182 RepID=A0ABV5IC27_9ACTN|nr:hypothetical protein [Nonomuraea spiralis]GGS79034.1 hypothetical protein GCM10010176_022810 [Nonomuraea spiralis]